MKVNQDVLTVLSAATITGTHDGQHGECGDPIMNTIFIRFPSHRARDYAVKALGYKPTFYRYQDFMRESGHGICKVSEYELNMLRNWKRVRFTVARNPELLVPCWSTS